MTFDTNFPTNSTPIPQFNQILTNWSKLNTVYGTDHAPYTEPDQDKIGHHKFVQFYDVQPDPTLASPQSRLYTKTQGTDRKLFFAQKPNVAAQKLRQLTDLLGVTQTDVSGGTNFNYTVYDTPWGWRMHIGQADAFNLSKNWNLTIGFVGGLIGAQATASGGASGVAPSITVNTGGNSFNLTNNGIAPVQVLIISALP